MHARQAPYYQMIPTPRSFELLLVYSLEIYSPEYSTCLAICETLGSILWTSKNKQKSHQNPKTQTIEPNHSAYMCGGDRTTGTGWTFLPCGFQG